MWRLEFEMKVGANTSEKRNKAGEFKGSKIKSLYPRS